MGSHDSTTSFATPHAYQGWTDQFLSTPVTGVEDIYVSGATEIGGLSLSLSYHDLSADEGDANYGSELGFVATKSLGAVTLTLKYADYSAEDFSTDTRKLWVMAAASF